MLISIDMVLMSQANHTAGKETFISGDWKRIRGKGKKIRLPGSSLLELNMLGMWQEQTEATSF